MYELFRIIRKDYPICLVMMNTQVIEAVIRGGGYTYFALHLAADEMNNDVLLQDIVILECLRSGREQVHMAQGRMAQHEFAERPIVRAVAEAARDDGDELASALHLGQRQRDKRGVEIDGLDTGLTQNQAMIR